MNFIGIIFSIIFNNYVICSRIANTDPHIRNDAVRTQGQEDTIKGARNLLEACKLQKSEEYCFQTIFGSNYFWN